MCNARFSKCLEVSVNLQELDYRLGATSLSFYFFAISLQVSFVTQSCQRRFRAIKAMGGVCKVIINSTGIFTIFFSCQNRLFHLIVQLDKLESIHNCLKTAWCAKRDSESCFLWGGTQYSCLVHLLEMISMIFLLNAISHLSRVVIIQHYTQTLHTHIKVKSTVYFFTVVKNA